ncbi:unnamed protein product [marine sediment metagenome]|uniref:Uncharacterized protein n=1 Tax=marine sediment metagenome TaxID=412755 RepID=X1A185_9ZZZZ
MNLKDVAIVAGIIGAGVLVATKWTEIKSIFEGIGTTITNPLEAIFGETVVPVIQDPDDFSINIPEVYKIPSFADLISGGTIPPGPIAPIPVPGPEDEPPGIFDLLNPFKGIEPYPEPTPTPPVSYPKYTPTVPPVFQPGPSVPSDPGHPATDPFLGGR